MDNKEEKLRFQKMYEQIHCQAVEKRIQSATEHYHTEIANLEKEKCEKATDLRCLSYDISEKGEKAWNLWFIVCEKIDKALRNNLESPIFSEDTVDELGKKTLVELIERRFQRRAVINYQSEDSGTYGPSIGWYTIKLGAPLSTIRTKLTEQLKQLDEVIQ
jgi:hypothetical protein